VRLPSIHGRLRRRIRLDGELDAPYTPGYWDRPVGEGDWGGMDPTPEQDQWAKLNPGPDAARTYDVMTSNGKNRDAVRKNYPGTAAMFGDGPKDKFDL
jgi:hypothetical protein